MLFWFPQSFNRMMNVRPIMNAMKKQISFLLTSLFLLVAMLAVNSPVQAAPKPKQLLVVTVTKGFRHSSIPTAEKVLGALAQKDGSFTVDYVRTDEEMAQKMTPAALKK